MQLDWRQVSAGVIIVTTLKRHYPGPRITAHRAVITYTAAPASTAF
jgi:hypothetical protein